MTIEMGDYNFYKFNQEKQNIYSYKSGKVMFIATLFIINRFRRNINVYQEVYI